MSDRVAPEISDLLGRLQWVDSGLTMLSKGGKTKESVSLINPLFRRESLNRQRLHAHGFVIKLVAVTAVEGVLVPLNVIALGKILA